MSSSLLNERPNPRDYNIPKEPLWVLFQDTSSLTLILKDLISLIHGSFVFLFLFSVALVHASIVPFFGIPWVIIHMKTYRSIGTQFWAESALNVFCSILEFGCGITLTLTCNPALYECLMEYYQQGRDIQKGSIILLSNHPTRLDWMWYWLALSRIGLLGHLVFVLKRSIRKWPVFGWIIQWIGIFMHRKWLIDESHFIAMSQCYSDPRMSSQSVLLFFAEGTDRYDYAIAKSHSYADSNQLIRYEYVMHPRTKGFSELVKATQKHSFLIIDSTIAYDKVTFKTQRCNELLLIQGKWNKRIYIHFECFDLYSIFQQFSHQNSVKNENEEKKKKKEGEEKDFFFCPLNSKPTPSQKQEWIQNYRQMDAEMRENALKTFVQKCFLLKEARLAEWYERKESKWIADIKDSHKMNLNQIPRIAYVRGWIFHSIVCAVWLWLYYNHLWVIGVGLLISAVMAHAGLVDSLYKHFWFNKLKLNIQNKKKI